MPGQKAACFPRLLSRRLLASGVGSVDCVRMRQNQLRIAFTLLIDWEQAAKWPWFSANICNPDVPSGCMA